MKSKIVLQIERPDHNKVILYNERGDTFTSKSEELNDFITGCAYHQFDESPPLSSGQQGAEELAEAYAKKEYGYEPTEETIIITHKAVLECAKMDWLAGYNSKPSPQVIEREKK